MISFQKRTSIARVLLAALLLAVLVWTGSARAQDAADEYGLLSSEAGAQGRVAILATGWHPVTGETPDPGAGSGGMVAVTGDEFVKSVSGRGEVSGVRRFEYLPFVAMTVNRSALEAAKRYHAGIQIWKDWPVKPSLAESGPMVGTSNLHRRGYTGRGTYVAVIDTGTDVAHPFFAGKLIVEACAADKCPNGRQRMVGPGAARPVDAHGTHVAGIALGQGEGMSGVAPEAGLIAINVFNPGGGARTSNILAGLELVVWLAHKRRINVASVNMSLGAPTHFSKPCTHTGYDILARLLTRLNVAVVAASGNESKNSGISAPACIRGIFSVGAVDKNNRVARFSNSAPILDILAPGVAIFSSVSGSKGGRSQFKKLSGTSMAAPHVAGAFAVLRQAAPRKSLEELASALKRGGRSTRDERNGLSKPSLDIARALKILKVSRRENIPPKADAGRGETKPSPEKGKPAKTPKQGGGWRPVGR